MVHLFTDALQGIEGHLRTKEFIAILNDYLIWCREKLKLSLGGLSPMEYRRSWTDLTNTSSRFLSAPPYLEIFFSYPNIYYRTFIKNENLINFVTA